MMPSSTSTSPTTGKLDAVLGLACVPAGLRLVLRQCGRIHCTEPPTPSGRTYNTIVGEYKTKRHSFSIESMMRRFSVGPVFSNATLFGTNHPMPLPGTLVCVLTRRH